MKAVKLKPTTCPCCEAEMDMALSCSPITGAQPKGGMIAICMGCGEMLVFKEDLTLRKAEIGDALKINPLVMLEIMQCMASVHERKMDAQLEAKRQNNIADDGTQEITE